MEKGYQEKGKNQEQKIIIADQKWGVNNEWNNQKDFHQTSI